MDFKRAATAVKRLSTCLPFLMAISLSPVVAQGRPECAGIFSGADAKSGQIKRKRQGYNGLVQEFVLPIDGVSGIDYARTNRGYKSIRDEWAGTGKSVMAPQDPQLQKKISEVLDLKNLRGKRIMDAGTGDGAFVENLRAKGIDIVGIDIALRDSQRGKGYFLEGSITDTGLPAESYDLIVSSYSVFHYFDHTQPHLYADSLAEMHRLLKPGGLLVLVSVAYGQKDIIEADGFEMIHPARDIRHGRYFLLEKK